MNKVILSLFGGVGLLDMGFEAAGFCVVRAGDLLWGSDIKKFDAKPLKGLIAGVIGGVPCQAFSSAVKLENRCNYENLWPDYYRIVKEIEPEWFLAENVKGAKDEALSVFSTPNNYHIKAKILDFSKLGSAQKRIRLITFGAVNSEITTAFFGGLEKNGLRRGLQWREKIGRESGEKYKTIFGDSIQGRQSKTEPAKFITGDDLLDAFDLPKNWSLPSREKFPRGVTSRLITQGVPVAAAYALAMAVKEYYEI